MKGEHVMRHQPGFWNGLWSDMMIETTFMKYGKGPRSSGGLIGVTVKPEIAKKVTLSQHIFATIKHGLNEMRNHPSGSSEKHKEEMLSRLKSDA